MPAASEAARRRRVGRLSDLARVGPAVEIVLEQEGEHRWVAYVEGLDGCAATATTPEEATALAQQNFLRMASEAARGRDPRLERAVDDALDAATREHLWVSRPYLEGSADR